MKLSYLGLALYTLSMCCFAVYIWFTFPLAAYLMLAVTGAITVYSVVWIELARRNMKGG